MIPAATADFYRAQQHRTVVTVALMRREWRLMGADFDRSWAKVGPRLTLLAGSSQLGAAHAAVAYVPKVLAETGQPDDPAAEVDPHGFSGVAADGRSLDGLLFGAVTTTKTAVGNGATPAQGLALGGRWLDMVAQGIVTDAGRAASGVAIATRPRMGYVRMVNPPSCSRCAMLAGRWYRYSDGFSRHPRCDCTMIPSSEDVAGDFTTDPSLLVQRGQVTDLRPAEAEALAEGADLSQVVNARRGASGLNGLTTTEGTTAKGLAGQRLNGARRLTPEGIYARANSRDEALTLLREHGYLTGSTPLRRAVTAAAKTEDPHSAAAHLIKRATAAEPKLTETVKLVAAKFGGEAVGLDFRLKGQDSLARKIAGDVAAGEGTASEIAAKMFDVNRYTIRYTEEDYAQSVQATLYSLRADGYTLKVKNYWTNDTNPYQGVNVQIVSPDGGQWELQFHTPRSLEVKEGEMHTIYEAARIETDPAKVAEYTAQSFAVSAKIPVPVGIESVS